MLSDLYFGLFVLVSLCLGLEIISKNTPALSFKEKQPVNTLLQSLNTDTTFTVATLACPHKKKKVHFVLTQLLSYKYLPFDLAKKHDHMIT